MIISHKHKFIFIKLRKTAGTSLEIALSGICGKDDIITPISNEDEAARAKLGYRGPQNFFVPKRNYKVKDWAGLVRKGQQPMFYNHMPAREIRDHILKKIWDNYFKFCFERNPWDKAISHFYHRSKAGNFNNIMDYLLNDKGDAIRGYDMYSVDDNILVDKIYRYEEMDDALAELSNTIGLNDNIQLPEYRAKSHFRRDTRGYRDVLTQEEADLISERFSREIDLMEYKF